MAYTPTDVANRALLAVGADEILGDIEDGTHAAQVCLIAYRDSLRALLRGAPWNFARKQVPLTLLADATGATPNTPTLTVPPWRYEYAYPSDCLRVRFIPHESNPLASVTGNYALPAAPLMPGLPSQTGQGGKLRPARFLITNDANYPPDPTSQWWLVEGQSPGGSRVICTDVANAVCVYTSMVLYPNVWDALFYEAMIAKLASEIAMPMSKDKKLGMAMRRDMIALAKGKLMEARMDDGNEAWSTTDHTPDWISARMSGGGSDWQRGGGGAGRGWDPVNFSDGSAF